MGKKHKEDKQAELYRKFIQAREDAACAIFESGSVRIDLDAGFELAIHEEYPEAPRSPIYLNLRPEGVKEGKLNRSHFRAIGKALKYKASASGLFDIRRAITPIPAAGERFFEAMLWELEEPVRKSLTFFPLEKLIENNKRKFRVGSSDDLDPKEYKSTLLVDDLVSSAYTKLLSVDAIEADGGMVTDLLVFLDRSNDAAEELKKRGAQLHAVWGFDCLMEWWLGKGYLTRKQFDTIIEYPARLDEYKRSVA